MPLAFLHSIKPSPQQDSDYSANHWTCLSSGRGLPSLKCPTSYPPLLGSQRSCGLLYSKLPARSFAPYPEFIVYHRKESNILSEQNLSKISDCRVITVCLNNIQKVAVCGMCYFLFLVTNQMEQCIEKNMLENNSKGKKYLVQMNVQSLGASNAIMKRKIHG